MFSALEKKESGFTLMEILIVVAIIGILSAIVLPRFLTSQSTAKKAAHRAVRSTVNAQLEQYYFTNGTYPAAMTNESWGTGLTYQNYFPDGVPTSCNQGVIWTILNGRIDSSTHTDHE
jgi:prepilin-type N-terminal cleavage/methylation domain-containing protein